MNCSAKKACPHLEKAEEKISHFYDFLSELSHVVEEQCEPTSSDRMLISTILTEYVRTFASIRASVNVPVPPMPPL